MSGHNKWSTIKHKKGAADAKRGKIFTKIIRELTMAARSGGGDAGANPTLRGVITKARAANMPQDNIERAIKKGTGELEGVNYEEITYEGYGAQGTAVLVECLTDNKNRTAADIRSIFNKRGGSMGSAGSVAWMFEKKGLIQLPTEQMEEDKAMEIALNAGAEDFEVDGELYIIKTAPNDFEAVNTALTEGNLTPVSAEVTKIAKDSVDVSEDNAKSVLGLIEALEDNDDVQNAYSNFNVSDDILKKLAEEAG
jgi:YebC/PmpR family DNA-binding regulatory protein